MKRLETNGAAIIKNNYLMSYNGLALLRWLEIGGTENEIWALMTLLHFQKGEVARDRKNSGLELGQKFQIRNVLNLYNQPVVESTYNEKLIAVPMMKSAIAPNFDAFLVILKESLISFVPMLTNHE